MPERTRLAFRSLPSPILSLGAAIAAALVWLGLAFATGLIYHLMPAAPPLAAAALLRWAKGRATWRAHLADITVATGVGLVGAAALGLAGQRLDAPWLTGLAALGGAVVALAALS